MRVLVTGGTGIVGQSLVRELAESGSSVRVLSRHAGRGETAWPLNVEGWAGDVTNESSIHGSADGCDVIVHVAGIADEEPPDRTFQRVNIDGTRYVVLEAERAGVKKLIYVSSLGAERGRSAYHKSKFVAEDVVRAFSRDWVVLRPGAVIGPGDEHVSVLLRMVRSLPVVPVLGDGTTEFQPIWHEDLAKAITATVTRDDIRCRTLDIAGPERTSQNDLIRRFRTLTGRTPVVTPLPEILASVGLRALDAIGVDVPLAQSQIEMLEDGNVIPPGCPNALTDVFGIAPLRLDDALARLVNEQPEQHPLEGVGAMRRKRFWIDIRGGPMNADALFEYLQEHLIELMPPVMGAKRDANPPPRIQEGQTLTLDLPLRGQAQVRVAEVVDRRITLLTVAGHPLAGAVRFIVLPNDDGTVRFEVQVYDRAANMFDQLMMRTVGEVFQRGAWLDLVSNVGRAAGGNASAIQTSSEELSDHELRVVNAWTTELASQLSRNATSKGRD